jgi:hypothetical protein
MKSKLIVVGSCLNFVTLLVGIAMGFACGTYKTNRVYAQITSNPAPNVEEISPAISAGSAAFGTLLAGREAVDNIVVGGIDLLKLHQNTLELLASKPLVFSRAEVESVINNSHAEKILRMKPPTAPKGSK